jgi:hypothetical protein
MITTKPTQESSVTRLIAGAVATIVMAGPAWAGEHCATFDQHPVGTAFTTTGEVLFRDDNMEIRTAAFSTGFVSAEVIPDNGIGASKQVIMFNNASLQLIATKPFAVANALVRDQGGFEMVGVTGAFPMDVELHDSPSITTALAKIEGGINNPDGVGRIHWETTTDQLLFSLSAGGQEFSVGEICIEIP